jgi:hypothetical protein
VTSTGDTHTTANTAAGSDASQTFSEGSITLLAGVGLLVIPVIAPFAVESVRTGTPLAES